METSKTRITTTLCSETIQQSLDVFGGMLLVRCPRCNKEIVDREVRGWFCPKCKTVYLHPDDDIEHEDFHESVTVVFDEEMRDG